ncbi:MAG TPA: helix-turn-helix domain-containing protein [Patescibacteria group bacterium]|nr:helix-turn-helix domain-containing protein [Patescibacteria group bacterium]
MIRVGQKLQEERIRKGYSLDDIAKATKIRVAFLRAIEEGDYKKLPSVTYVSGFVKNYIDFLELPEKPYLALFRREFNEGDYQTILPENISASKEISVNKVRIRQALILAGVAILGLLLYIFFQYRQAIFSPSLVIDQPKENAAISTQTVIVSGHTEQNDSVTINTIPVVVDESGNFRKEIGILGGTTTITITSTNTFGKTTTVLRHIRIKGE